MLQRGAQDQGAGDGQKWMEGKEWERKGADWKMEVERVCPHRMGIWTRRTAY